MSADLAEGSAAGAGRRWADRGVGLTITLLVLCQSVQMLAARGISLFLPVIRSDVGLTFTQGARSQRRPRWSTR